VPKIPRRYGSQRNAGFENSSAANLAKNPHYTSREKTRNSCSGKHFDCFEVAHGMERTLRRIFRVLAIAAAVAWPSVAQAGTTGVVGGRVYDEHGQPISGATVSITMLKDWGELNSEVDMRPYEAFRRTTDLHGFFVYPSLSPGYYVMMSSKSGESFDCAPRVIVDADQTTFVDLSMISDRMLVKCAPPRYIYPITERLPLQKNNR